MNLGALPMRPRPPDDFRPNSTAGSMSSGFSGPASPVTARPPFAAQRDPGPHYNMRGPPPRDQMPRDPMPPPPIRDLPPRSMFASPAPTISEQEIDTKSGGEAGMAGVGRRGFAAAARAAMFVMPRGPQGPLPPPDNAPYNLNTNVPMRTNDITPPLSAGSGYSSHSPSISPYPQSPAVLPSRLPSPRFPSPDPTGPTQTIHRPMPSLDKSGLPTSPLSLRMPFFDKLKNQLSSASSTSPTSPIPTNTTDNDSPSVTTAKQPDFPATRPRASTSASSASSYSQVAASRSLSMSTTASRPAPPQPDKRSPSPTASDLDSEYGGLAYADSTDDEDEDDEPLAALKSDAAGSGAKGKGNPPPPLPLTTSILRSGSIASVNHVRFPSSSVRSDRTSNALNNFGQHKRGDSSVSSSSASGEARKRNSAAIAQALGLSQAPPSTYGRLGGPGSVMGGRGRSASGSSGSSRSGYSGGGSASGMGALEKEVKTLLEAKDVGLDKDKDAAIAVEQRDGLVKSKSTGKQRSFGAAAENSAGRVPPFSADAGVGVGSGAKAHRSNTVQVAPSSTADSKTPKLPARARTSAAKGTEVPARKPKVCLKCDKKIENGRWVQVDNGGVLCEKCWKNLYLPKCRRCNLPIENQAVSSADGQLKGKYHRECFNCHTCHKPFPDKSFYVFDGKPLCAYHYHEANDSLCAAARCGQPIEGPCAVSHTGDRYHPEHMTCEYPGSPGCKQRLEEYWEVDGRMLCERHAHASKVGSDDEEGEEKWVQSSKALKRVTRFIDLAGRAPSPSEDGNGLR
ncbi:hypothetical protein DXG03_005724 [Asterophora parasitica]|uniref:LIM zinc-binding domain-containing protein n=1 Tax=Asterophora parasitica TaxID=117018 RepID=A0A9P7KF65_9AGAR|nr:hypothetical protein DXG03_005724 [Asterophora parasitica]